MYYSYSGAGEPRTRLAVAFKLNMAYELHFRNNTDRSLWFVEYQNRYTYDGQDSVAWKLCGVAENGSGSIPWTLNYGVALVDFHEQPVRRYTITQGPLNVERGHTYEVTTDKNGILSLSPTSIGPAPLSEIVIANNTTPGEDVSIGLTLSDSLIAAERRVGGGMKSVFTTYSDDVFVDCYTNQVKQGAVVTRYPSSGLEGVDTAIHWPGGLDAILEGPNVNFKAGVYEHTLEASKSNGTYHLRVINY